MIVHMDLNLNEVLYCNECEEELSNDAWLQVTKNNVDSIMCKSCSQSLTSKVNNDG